MSQAVKIAVTCVACREQVDHGGRNQGVQIALRPNGRPALVHARVACRKRWEAVKERLFESGKLLPMKETEAMPAADPAAQAPTNGAHRPLRVYTTPAMLLFLARRIKLPHHGWNNASLFAEVKSAFPDWYAQNKHFGDRHLFNSVSAYVERAQKLVDQVSPEQAVVHPSRALPASSVPPPTAPLAATRPSADWTPESLNTLADLAAQVLKLLAQRGKSELVVAVWDMVASEAGR